MMHITTEQMLNIAEEHYDIYKAEPLHSYIVMSDYGTSELEIPWQEITSFLNRWQLNGIVDDPDRFFTWYYINYVVNSWFFRLHYRGKIGLEQSGKLIRYDRLPFIRRIQSIVQTKKNG